MIKYVRTINSHIGAPEICYMTGSYSSAIYANSIYSIDQYGYLTPQFIKESHKYLTLESKKSNTTEKLIKCIRVMPGMVFETTSISNPEGYKAGLRGTLGEGPGGSLQYFLEEGNDVELFDHHYSPNPDALLFTVI